MDGNNENIYGIDGNSAFMKKNTMEEMRRCLIYMSRLWGADKGLLIVAFIMLTIFKQNSFTLVWFIYGVNAMSLSIYGNNYDEISAMGGHGKLTLSMPMSRKTIYDTRMYLVGGLYLLAIVLALIPLLQVGMLYRYILYVLLLLMGHVMCGLSIRKPYLQIVSGVPACIVLFISVMLDLFDVSQTIVSKIANIRGNLVEACLCIIMLIVDIIVWLRERRLFVGNKGYRDYKIREEISKC